MAASPKTTWTAVLVVLASSSTAAAQPQPLPPLPPASEPAPASAPALAPAPAPALAPAPAPAPASGPPPPPPVLVYVAPEPPVHAPHFSLWLGGRAGLLAYSGGLYVNNQQTGAIETTGNFVRPGLGLELDVGARLGKRYIPYLALELGVAGAGHRFDSSTSASTSFLGVGFRYLAGNVDTVAFASDLSVGIRKFQVSNSSGTWTASGLEIFRLGLGAEVRVNNYFAVSPMLTLSGGTLTDTSGNISFAPNQGDLQTGPGTILPGGGFLPFVQNQNIPSGAQTTYIAVVVGCGGHIDLFGH
jgi:hypothetical protein